LLINTILPELHPVGLLYIILLTSKVLAVFYQAPCQESVRVSRKRGEIVPDDDIEINRMSRRMAGSTRS